MLCSLNCPLILKFYDNFTRFDHILIPMCLDHARKSRPRKENETTRWGSKLNGGVQKDGFGNRIFLNIQNVMICCVEIRGNSWAFMAPPRIAMKAPEAFRGYRRPGQVSGFQANKNKKVIKTYEKYEYAYFVFYSNKCKYYEIVDMSWFGCVWIVGDPRAADKGGFGRSA